MSHPLSETGEFCAVCERTIEWDGHSEVAHLEARIEAALALHKTRMGGPFCPECGQPAGKDGYCTSPTVKALKGKGEGE